MTSKSVAVIVLSFVAVFVHQCSGRDKFDAIVEAGLGVEYSSPSPLFMINTVTQDDDECIISGQRFDPVTNACRSHRCPTSTEPTSASPAEIVRVVVGVVVGGILVIVAIALLLIIIIFCCYKRSTHSVVKNESELKQTIGTLNKNPDAVEKEEDSKI